MRLTDREFWEHRWRSRSAAGRFERVHPGVMPFHPLFSKVLPRDCSYVEVGCAPGRHMVYFNRYFDYRVAGIDFVSGDISRRTLDANQVEGYRLYQMDFLEELPPARFDVVASFGFVEHFTDLKEVIARHVALVNPGGYVVIAVPNFRWGQYLIRRVLDPASLGRHNLEAMKCPVIRRILVGLGAREIIYCGYYRTFEVWIQREDLPRSVIQGVGLFNAGFQRLARWLRVDNLPNRFFSPYCVTIARF